MRSGCKGKWSGFLLLESHFGLFAFSLISLQVIPLTLFLHHQSLQREHKLEAHRYSIELAAGNEASSRRQKESGRDTYYGEMTGGQGYVTRLVIKDSQGKVLVDIYEK